MNEKGHLKKLSEAYSHAYKTAHENSVKLTELHIESRSDIANNRTSNRSPSEKLSSSFNQEKENRNTASVLNKDQIPLDISSSKLLVVPTEWLNEQQETIDILKRNQGILRKNIEFLQNNQEKILHDRSTNSVSRIQQKCQISLSSKDTEILVNIIIDKVKSYFQSVAAEMITKATEQNVQETLILTNQLQTCLSKCKSLEDNCDKLKKESHRLRKEIHHLNTRRDHIDRALSEVSVVQGNLVKSENENSVDVSIIKKQGSDIEKLLELVRKRFSSEWKGTSSHRSHRTCNDLTQSAGIINLQQVEYRISQIENYLRAHSNSASLKTFKSDKSRPMSANRIPTSMSMPMHTPSSNVGGDVELFSLKLINDDESLNVTEMFPSSSALDSSSSQYPLLSRHSQNDISNLIPRQSNLENLFRSFTFEIRAEMDELRENETRQQEMNVKLKSKVNELSSMMTSVGSVASAVDTLLGEAKRWEVDNASVVSQMNTLISSVDERLLTLEDQQRNQYKRHTQLAPIATASAIKTDEQLSLSSRVNSLEEQFKSYLDDYKTLQNNGESLKSVEDLSQVISSIKDTQSTMRTDSSILSQQQKALNSQLRSLSDRMKDFQIQTQEKVAELDEFAEELAEDMHGIENAQQTQMEGMKAVLASLDDIVRLEADISSLKDNMKNLGIAQETN